jgi:hypothetical protein
LSINRYRRKRQELADLSQIAGGLAEIIETNTAAIVFPEEVQTRNESEDN